MTQVVRAPLAGILILAVFPFYGCQSPTSSSSSVRVDDYLITSASPDPATAEESHGKTYRVVRGNNQPDDILEFDWKTSFTITVTLNDRSDDKDVGLTFPVDLTAVTVKVQQASGGIVTPPSGGDVEHSDYVVTQSSGNRFNAVGNTITMSFDVWYDLPNLRKEALISVALAMADKEGLTTGKTVNVRVAP
jgi:hypothetical protein